MKYSGVLLVVKDMERAKQFYRDVLGLRVTVDFGANVTLTGGIALQTLDTWSEFIVKDATEMIFGHNTVELYFEEDNFDKFIEKLDSLGYINYVHTVSEADWGQRSVRFYDLDMHIIEVGENIKHVVQRFVDAGLTNEQIAKRMDIDIRYVKGLLRKK